MNASLSSSLRTLQRVSTHWNIPFFLAIALILIGVSLRFPSFSTHAEVFAESGLSFFYYAHHAPLLQNIFEFQIYNYLTWLPRLVAVLTVKVLNATAHYHQITQWSALGCSAIFYALFCLKAFRSLLPSDLARFLISVALGIGLLGDYELYAFINFTYHGLFLLIVLPFVNLQRWSQKRLIALLALVVLVVTSKTHSVAFLPFYGLLLLLGWFGFPFGSPMPLGNRSNSSYGGEVLSLGSAGDAFRNRMLPGRLWHGIMWHTNRSHLFYGLITAFIGLQLIANYIANTYFHFFRAPQQVRLSELLQEAIFFFLKSYAHLLFPTSFLKASYGLSIGLTVAVIIGLSGVALYQFRRASGRIASYFFIYVNALAFINVFLLVYLIQSFPLEFNNWDTPNLPFQNRWFLLSLMGILLGMFVLIVGRITSRNKQAAVTIGILLYLIWANLDYHTVHHNYLTEPSQSHSQWSQYHGLTEHEDYCIPINPYPYLLNHRCSELEQVAFQEGQFVSSRLPHYWIRGLIVIEGGTGLSPPYSLVAYDEQGNAIGQAERLTPEGYVYPYFVFHPKVTPHRLQLVNAEGNPFLPSVKGRLLGRGRPKITLGSSLQ